MAESNARHRAAQLMERDRAGLERIGIRAASRHGGRARLAAIKAYRRGGNVVQAFAAELDEAKPILVDAMVAAHLRGRLRTMVNAGPQLNRTTKLRSGVYETAIEFARRRLELPEAKALQLRATYVAAANQLFEETQRALEKKINGAIIRFTQNGLHVREGVVELQRALDAGGVTPANSYTLENLFRTQTQLAYSAGRWNALAEPEIDEILWGFEYVTVGDSRVRPSHQAMDGIRLPKAHPFWQSHFPPNGFSCRCAAIEIYEPESPVEPGPKIIDGQSVEPIADDGFRFNPGQVFADSI